MNDCGKTARPLPGSHLDQLSPPGRALAQRALACELTGELERAVALIRCLQGSPPDAPLAAVRSRDEADRAAAPRPLPEALS